MANHKSAAKRARQSVKKEEVNARTKSTVKTFERKLRKSIAAKDLKGSQDLLRQFSSKIDRAAKKGIYHSRAASRKISRLSSQVSALG